MIKWPKRYSWTDPKGTSRLVRVLEPLGDRGDAFTDSQRVEVEDVNTRKRFPNVLFKTLAIIE